MSAKLVSLNGHEIASAGQPDAKVVACLEKLLEAARSGDVTGVAIAVQHSDGATSTRIHGYLLHHSTLGALEMLKHRLLSED